MMKRQLNKISHEKEDNQGEWEGDWTLTLLQLYNIYGNIIKVMHITVPANGATLPTAGVSTLATAWATEIF